MTSRSLPRSLLLLALLLSLGCSRAHYRRQADRDVHCLIDQKGLRAESTPGEFRLPVDPRSRMYDPHDADCPPMPPDDPAAALYLKCVDGKRGSADWQQLPRTSFVDNPTWQQHLPRDEKGQVVIDGQGAVDLALLHSSDYQSQVENLYLSALDVTFERFQFDTQFFGGSDVFFTADGPDRSGRANGSSLLGVSPARPGNRWRAERLTATGGQLVVGLANSLVWQFASPDNYSGTTLLDFSLVQPLLRAGGRTVVLERLTAAERGLLANVRQMERYRRGFYVSVLTGRAPGQGPTRRLGGAGFGNFSNLGATGVVGAGGYLGLLQDLQELRNQRANVAALRASVVQLEATFEAGRIDRFQVDLARQSLFNSQSSLITAEVRYRTSVESFQSRFGLSPEIDVAIRDPLLDRFNLLDPSLESLKAEVAQLLDQLRDRRQQLADTAAGPDPPAASVALDAELDAAQEVIDQIVLSIDEQFTRLDEDFEQLAQALPQRRKALDQLAQRPEVQEAQIDASILSAPRLDRHVESRKVEKNRLEGLFAKTQEDLTRLGNQPAETPEKQLQEAIRLLGRTAGELLELSLLQASVRLESVTLSPVELTPTDALAIASTHRRDWKNARANLVDSWRFVYFSANDLESNLDLVFSGDLGNVGQNPFDLRSSNGRLRVGLQFDAPLTRLAERNVYRESLIRYQQARRGYYDFRDQLYLQLRNELRQMRLNEINLELRRAAVQLAISQVDLSRIWQHDRPRLGAVAFRSPERAERLFAGLGRLRGSAAQLGARSGRHGTRRSWLAARIGNLVRCFSYQRHGPSK